MIVVSGGIKRPFHEETSTLSLNSHGILVAIENTVVIGQNLTLHNPANWAERGGRVTRLGVLYAGRTEVGIEFTEPAPGFWDVDVPLKRIKPAGLDEVMTQDVA